MFWGSRVTELAAIPSHISNEQCINVYICTYIYIYIIDMMHLSAMLNFVKLVGSETSQVAKQPFPPAMDPMTRR